MNKQKFERLSEVKLNEFSNVDITFHVAPPALKSHPRILRVCFAGAYGHGAGGNDDACYMEAMSRAAVDIFSPDGIIFDFSKLSYEWGDMLSRVFDVAFAWFSDESPPFALVLGKGCEPAMRSLLADDGWTEEDFSRVHLDMTDAQNYVQSIMDKI
jgi:hypothetical protein